MNSFKTVQPFLIRQDYKILQHVFNWRQVTSSIMYFCDSITNHIFKLIGMAFVKFNKTKFHAILARLTATLHTTNVKYNYIFHER